ncbi:MAG: amino acid adenylation domain-containing protein [Gemmatimonadetes bacterium]|nr:amino acid adenylation domain-containing protein [Gemmatimonadota bacterium]
MTAMDTFPLSFAQRRLWFVHRLEPASSAYNVPLALRLRGPLDIAALERALATIQARHESLRTTFREIDGEPVQVINPEVTFRLAVVDLRAIAIEKREEDLAARLRAETHRPFDLAVDSVLRATVFHLAEGEAALVVVMHHIAADGWSMGVLVRELSTLYQAFTTGRDAALPELPIQYADFAVWQREWLDAGELTRQLDYWRSALADLPTVELPTDRPRGRWAPTAGGTMGVAVPDATAVGIRRICREQSASTFMLMLAAFKVLLQRYTGQTDLVVGSPIANRHRTETEPLIGFFVNNLVLRTDCSGNPTFLELLARVRAATLAGYANQDMPFEQLVEILQPDRDPSRNPLFQISFAGQNVAIGAFEFGRVSAQLQPIDLPNTRFDLEVFVWEADPGISVQFNFSADLFDPATVARMADRYRVLLDAIVADPTKRIEQIPLLAPDELDLLLHRWNATAAPGMAVAPLPALFEAQVRLTPDAGAVVTRDGTLTYRELNERANRVAHRLRALGVQPDDVVGLATGRSLEMVVGLFGISKAGGAYLPLDPTHPVDRLRFVLDDAKPPVVVVDEPGRAALPSLSATMVSLADPALAGEAAIDPAPVAELDHLAYVLYTSGSTGRPKGTLITHGGLANYLVWAKEFYRAGEGTGSIVHSPLGFDLTVTSLLLPLIAGQRVQLLPEDDDVAALAEAVLAGTDATLLKLTPAHLSLLEHQIPSDRAAGLVRRFVIGGENLRWNQLTHWRRHAPDTRLINEYGPTETVVGCCVYDAAIDSIPEGNVPIGRPIANTQLYVLDARRQPVPIGIPGELYIGGAGVARGYLNRPDLTRDRFIPNPFNDVPGARLYRTGDKVRYRPDGVLEFLGRLDDQVKIRGYRIELGEIEGVLSEHPSVEEAAVLAHEAGVDDRRLVAFVSGRTEPDGEAEVAPLSAAQVTEWRRVYEDLYAAPGTDDPAFDIAGWNSSFTGEAIPAVEMREWIDDLVARVMEQPPGDVLDVGCGTGLILFRVAPRARSYTGLDFSAPVIERLERQLAGRADLGSVRVLNRTAGELGALPAGQFDTIIINSVIQYFPGVDYLTAALDDAARLLRPGGRIIVGDVRSLPLLEAFHLAIDLGRTDPSTPADDLAVRLHRNVLREKELVIDPRYFRAWLDARGLSGEVAILPKRDRRTNELTVYRFDAIVRIGAATKPDDSVEWLTWQDEGTLALARRRLAQPGGGDIGIRGVPNVRVAGQLAAVEALAGLTRPATAADLAALATRPIGADPEDLWQLAADLPCQPEVRWDGAGTMTVRYRRGDRPAAEAGPAAEPRPTDLTRFANNPLLAKQGEALVADLRARLAARLPEYMIPGSIVVLDRLPLTSNGKVDRRALRAMADRPTATAFVPPATDLERQLADIWREVLEVDRVSAAASFFELGGHSLLATRVSARIRERLRIAVPLRALFEHPTIQSLATHLDTTRWATTAATTVAAGWEEGEL